MLKKFKNRQKYNFSLSSHSFSSSGRTDLQKYSNSPSWSTDSKNVKIIFVGPGVQVQLYFKELKGREKKTKNVRIKDFSNLFKYKLNLNPWAYKNGFYIFGICVPRRLIWVLLEVCTTTRTKTVKRKRSVLRKLRQDIWRDKTFVRSCMYQLGRGR